MLTPLGPRVLIRPDNPVSKTGGGIVIPDKAQKATTRGVVLAVGDWEEEGYRMPEVGDRVIFSQYAGTEIKEGDEILLLLTLKDVFCLIGEEG